MPLRLLLLVSLILIIALPARLEISSSSIARARGVYALMYTSDNIDTFPFAGRPITGISAREVWNGVEVPNNTFDWAYFDSAVAMARAQGLYLYLRVRPGTATPNWVYTQGADSVILNGGDECPLPWQDTFLVHWCDFIKKFGERYGAEPLVRFVNVTGPNATTTEMMLAKYTGEKDTWLAAGYANAKVVAAWKTCIDSFAAAFPNAVLTLNMATVMDTYGSSYNIVREVIAYGVERYPNRFAIQYNAFKDTTGTAATYQYWLDLVKEYNDTIIVGFQQNTSYSAPFGGNVFASTLDQFDAAVRLGGECGMDYLEFYREDVFAESAAVDARLLYADKLCRAASSLPIAPGVSYLTAKETTVSASTPQAATDSFLIVQLPQGETTASGALAAAALADSQPGFIVATRLLESDSATIRIWSVIQTPSVWLAVRSDSATLDSSALPAGIPATETGLRALAATALQLEFGDAEDNMIGDTTTTTVLGETYAYNLVYDLSETTTALYRALGFDTSPGSTSFSFHFADTYGGAWTQDTTCTVTVAAGLGGGIKVTVAGLTRDLPGGLGGVAAGSSGAGPEGGCLVTRLGAPAWLVGWLRALRDLLLATCAGRAFTAAYYAVAG